MGVELLRFDMSEYMEKHTVSRLIGAPPGYVGFDQGGLLTDGIDQHPHCVLLLDEIEKAHPDLFNILLQVMDHGKLTDHNGKKVDFRNVVLIMTTNAGAADMARPAMGFGRTKREGDDTEAINRMFTPEFRNRLDAVIPFSGLPPEVILKVVEKFVFQLEAQLADRGVTIELTEQAAQVAGRDGLRREVRRPAAGARHPGAHQEAAGRRAAVRQARARRHRARAGRQARARSASSPSSTSPPSPRPKGKGKDDDEDDDSEESGEDDAGAGRGRAAQGAVRPQGQEGPSQGRRRAQRPAPQGRLAVKPARLRRPAAPWLAWAAGSRNSVSESWSPPCRRQPRKPVRLRGDCW